MGSKYLILTNNSMAEEYYSGIDESKYRSLEIYYINSEVQQIINRTIYLIKNGWHLAVDPLAGRRIRPFPVISILLKTSKLADLDTSAFFFDDDEKRLEDYLNIDRNRKYEYMDYPEELLKDYQMLDLSLLQSAFENIK